MSRAPRVAALKRLHVLEAARPDVELKMWVLVASGGDAAPGKFPEELKEVIGTLKSTLTYRRYALAASFVQRVRDGARGVHGEGVTDLGEPGEKSPRRKMQLEYGINGFSLEPGDKGHTLLRLDGFSLTLVGDGRAQLRADVTLRDGEKVVVGTSTVQDRGLVVVMSGRVLR